MKTPSQALGLGIVLCLVASCCSLLFEFILLKVITRFTDDLVIWEAVTMGFYLAAIGTGVLHASAKVPTPSWRLLLNVELGITMLGSTSVSVLLLFHTYYRINLRDWGLGTLQSWWLRPIHIFAIYCQFVTLAVGFLSGWEITLLFKNLRTHRLMSMGLFHGAYCLGSLLATLLFSFYFLPYLDLGIMAQITALLNATLAYVIWNTYLQRYKVGLALLVGAIFVVVGNWTYYPIVQQLHLKNFYYNELMWREEDGVVAWLGPVPLGKWLGQFNRYPQILQWKSPYQAIDWVPIILGDQEPLQNDGSSSKRQSSHYSLYLDGHYQFDTIREADYHEHMAHIPSMFFRKIPRTILILGGGDGLLVKQLLKYKERVGQITLIELDAAILELASSQPLVHFNQGALSDPKVKLVHSDAFWWLQHLKVKYDAVYMDFPFPYSFDAQRLYTVEFFRLLASRLKEEGFVVMDFPLNIDSLGQEKTRAMIMSTLHQSGFAQKFSFVSSYDSFVAASLSIKALHAEFIDYKIPLQTFNRSWFKDTSHWQVYSKAPDLTLVHSLLKPKILGYGDRSF